MILAGLLLGCPGRQPLCVQAANPAASALAFELGEGSGCATTPVVRRFEVTRDDGTPLWALFSGDGVPLRTVVYGQVPAGFEAAGAAEPVAPGQTVVVEVKGPVESGGLTVALVP